MKINAAEVRAQQRRQRLEAEIAAERAAILKEN